MQSLDVRRLTLVFLRKFVILLEKGMHKMRKTFYDIEKFTETLGHGADRIALYSEEYDLVLKYNMHYNPQEDDQTLNERRIWDKMTSREKLVFPAVKFFCVEEKWYVVMRKVIPFASLNIHFSSYEVGTNNFECYCLEAHANLKNIAMIRSISYKYGLHDLHSANLGMLPNGDIVIIDMGL